MNIDLDILIPVLIIVGIGSYIQTVVGFAFGLIFIALSTSLNLLPVQTTAILISFLALVNTFAALFKDFKNVLWPKVITILIVSIPMMGVGLYLLDFLVENNMRILRVILGITIFSCALLLLKQPKTEARPSSLISYGFTGLLAGLLGGLFATSGPPVVFQFYRQPLPMAVIRDSLLGVFLVSSFARTSMVVMNGTMEQSTLILGLFAIPVVILFTRLGRLFPPKLSEKHLRHIVFALLAFTSVTLIAQ